VELEARINPNITLTNAFLVNVNDQAMPNPDKGEQISIEADWTTQNLPSNASYQIRYSVDGVTLSTNFFSYGAGFVGTQSWYWYLGGWYAAPGTHNVTVTVNPTTYGNTSRSFSFTPVTAPDLPAKFVTPLGGTPFQTWGITNYVDVNPFGGSYTDYQGNGYTYDGHQGHDMSPANFGTMDAGLADYAAAAGTVVAVQDSNYDRNTVMSNAPANYVEIDHGNGWHTIYYHLRTDTILLHVGDTVVAGQMLGLAGSSGDSTGVHLHFQVMHNGDVVEPEDDPTTYWANPLPYQGNVSDILDSSVTSVRITATNDLNVGERPVAANVFSQATGQQLTVWFQGNTRNNDNLYFRFYMPSGIEYTGLDYTFSASESHGGYWYYYNTLPANLPLGTWHVGISINGTQMAYDPFQVTASGAGAARVAQGTTYVPNGRTTPLDYGTVSLGASSPQRSYTVSNLGSAPLTLSNLTLPSGFSLVGSFPSNVSVGGTATFTLQMSTAVSGINAGMVQFNTSDPNAPTYSFNIKGTVGGSSTGEIHGQVFQDSNKDGIEMAGEAGLVGWTVSLLNPLNNNVITTTTTSYNGYYAFLNLAAGTYRVRETSPSGWAQSTLNPPDITVGTTDLLASPFGVAPLLIVSTTPANGAIVATPPTSFVINFNEAVVPASVLASTLQVNGISATGVSLNGNNTAATFTFTTSPVTAQGVQSMVLAANTITGVDGATNTVYSSTFYYDALPLAVTSTTPAAGGTFTLPGSSYTYQVTFNEPIDPATVSTSNLTLSQGTVTAAAVQAGNQSVVYTITGLVTESTLTVTIPSGTLVDQYDNPVFTAFTGTYNLDVGTAPLPTSLTPVGPSGSQVYTSGTPGVINFAGDTEKFTLALDPTQTITVLVTPGSSSLQPTVQLSDPSGTSIGSASASGAGQNALLQTIAATTAGTYTITVGGVGSTGSYTLQVYLNAALEAASVGIGSDKTLATAQDLNPSLATVQTSVSKGSHTTVLGSLGQSTTLNATDTGWYDSTGFHDATNKNYWVSQSGGTQYRDYAVFNLSGVSQPITAATLNLFNPSDGYNSPLSSDTYSLFDVSTPIATLQGSHTGQVGIFNDLGTGNSYGSQPVTYVSDNEIGQIVSTTLNATGVSALNSSLGGPFAFGGALTSLQGNNQNLFGDTGNTVFTRQLVLYFADSDYYSLTLAAGQNMTVGLATLTGSGDSLAIQDANGNILATGVAGAANLDSAITGFVAPSTGTYYLVVSGTTAATYSLVVTRDATFDTKSNTSFFTAQDLTGTTGSLGALTQSTPPNVVVPAAFANTETGAYNGYPFILSPFNNPSMRYQQIYSASAFVSGGVIDAIRFRRAYGQAAFTSTTIDVNISLAYAATTVVTASPTFAANIGPGGLVNVYSGTLQLSSTSPDTSPNAFDVVINLMHPFTYNPAQGDLLLDISVLNSPGGQYYLEATPGGSQSLTTRIFAKDMNAPTGYVGFFNSNTASYGLVTRFDFAPQTPPAPDWYQITLAATQTGLQLETATPGGGPGEPVNLVSPQIQLYDSSLTLLATGSLLPDGRNQSLTATGLTPGTTYYIQVSSADNNGGDYFLGLAVPTTTTLTDNGPNPSSIGQGVSFTVNVSPTVPSNETVLLEDAGNNNAVVGTATLINGSATITLSSLSGAVHSLVAVYGGDGTYSPSQSATVTHIVGVQPNQPPFNIVPRATQQVLFNPAATVGLQTATPNTIVYSAANHNAIFVSDSDGGSIAETTTLTVGSSGTLTLAGTSNLTNVTGNGTGTVSFTGLVSDLNNALNGLLYTPGAGFTGNATLTVTTNDNNTSAITGPLTDVRTTRIQVVGLYFSEVMLATGSASPNQYLEIYSTVPSYTIPSTVYLVGINGQVGAGQTLGEVQDIFKLAGLTTGPNGTLALLDNGQQYSFTGNTIGSAGSSYVANSGTGAGFGNGTTTSVFGTVSNVHLGGARAAGQLVTDIAQGAESLLLIQAPAAPTTSTNIDPNNNGTTGGAAYNSWNVLDSVAILDGASTSRAYAAITFRPFGATGSFLTGSTWVDTGTSGSPWTASYVGRVGKSTGSTGSSWLASVPAGSNGAFTLGTTQSTQFPGQALNSVGGPNYWAPQAPVLVNDGSSSQHSQVSELTVTFNEPVSIGNLSSTFQVMDAPTGGTALNITVSVVSGTVNGNSATNVTVIRIKFNADATHTIAFTNPDPFGNTVGLNDGNYFLNIVSANITTNGAPMDGGVSEQDEFWRLFGDVKGIRTSDGIGSNSFQAAYSSTSGSANYLYFLDWNLDGTINGTDLTQLRSRYGTRLAP
jgi:murein DD-endopeptidase MepM/ murein hydrolase activator NlpD